MTRELRLKLAEILGSLAELLGSKEDDDVGRQVTELSEEIIASRDNQTGKRKEIETSKVDNSNLFERAIESAGSKLLECAGIKRIDVPATVEEYACLEQFAKDKNLAGVEQLFQDYIDQIMQENFGQKPYRKFDKINLVAEAQDYSATGVRIQDKHRRELLQFLSEFHTFQDGIEQKSKIEFYRIRFHAKDDTFTFRDHRIDANSGEVFCNDKRLETKDLAEFDKYILREANDVLHSFTKPKKTNNAYHRLHKLLEATEKELVLEKRR